MIFQRDDGQLEGSGGANFVPPRTPYAKFLFDTNEGFRKSAIVVTHSKQTAGPLSIRYKWTIHRTPQPSKKIAESLISTDWIPRA
jgi:hypothetical protein